MVQAYSAFDSMNLKNGMKKIINSFIYSSAIFKHGILRLRLQLRLRPHQKECGFLRLWLNATLDTIDTLIMKQYNEM
jgi:hypothetical protein